MENTIIDKSKPVMLTGATGYVAGWIVKKLLKQGFTVHAPVRDINNVEKLKYLNEIAADAVGSIKYFEADLLKEGSYDEAAKGCEIIFHTASPFSMEVKDPMKELVEPALLGTENVLNTANKTESVKRVVLTSSCAAIIGDAKDCLTLPNNTATEKDWNFSSTVNHQAYSYSKTIAEKKAWKINKNQSRWDLVVINPSFVIGPGINPNGSSESFSLVRQMGDGQLKTGVPEFFVGVIDVRDLADAHLKVAFNPQSKGRHIISNQEVSFLQLSKILQKEFGDKYPFPKRELPKFLVWIMAPTVGFKRKMIWLNIGYHWLVDNTKSKTELAMKYRPVEESIIDFFQQQVDAGYFKSKV